MSGVRFRKTSNMGDHGTPAPRSLKRSPSPILRQHTPSQNLDLSRSPSVDQSKSILGFSMSHARLGSLFEPHSRTPGVGTYNLEATGHLDSTGGSKRGRGFGRGKGSDTSLFGANMSVVGREDSPVKMAAGSTPETVGPGSYNVARADAVVSPVAPAPVMQARLKGTYADDLLRSKAAVPAPGAYDLDRSYKVLSQRSPCPVMVKGSDEHRKKKTRRTLPGPGSYNIAPLPPLVYNDEKLKKLAESHQRRLRKFAADKERHARAMEDDKVEQKYLAKPAAHPSSGPR